MLINKKQGNCIKRVAVCLGADKESDYNSLIETLKFRGKWDSNRKKSKTSLS